jgi:predicted NACHT family NTPase
MPGQQSAASLGGTAAKLVMTLVALASLAVVTVGLWPEVRGSPVWSVAVLVICWLVLAAVRFVGLVGSAVGKRWVPSVAEACDRTVSAVLLSYRSKYLDQLGRGVRDIDLLGVATQGEYTLRLRQVYVELSVLPRALHETSGEPFVGKMGISAERRTLASFLGGAEPGVFAVIGGPGSGKTTLLRRTALELCQRRVRTRALPVLLYLRDHVDAIVRAADAGPTLASVGSSVTWMPGTVPADWLERRLHRGRCLVMLDGLDEVAIEGDRQKVVAWVRRQIERYPKNDYVITSRPYGYLANPLSKANVLQVRRFTGEQISQFIQDWYYAIECRSTGDSGDKVRLQSKIKAGDLLSRVRGQPALYDLAANPLLLTMIANVHRYRGALPGSRAALYGEMCEVLLHRRQEAKGLSAVGTGLRGEQKERVVRELALHMMVKKIRDIPADQARQALKPALSRVSRNVQPPEFLKETVTSGLLVEREAGVYAFAHQTFQEYLAAIEIKETRLR